MKKFEKIVAISIITLFIFSSFATVVSKEEDEPSGASLPPLPMMSPKSKNFKQLDSGNQRSTSFDVWNNQIDYGDYQYRTLFFEVNVNEEYQGHLSVDPTNGYSPSANINVTTGETEYFKNAFEIVLRYDNIKRVETKAPFYF